MAITSYDDILSAASAGRIADLHFLKTLPAVPAAGTCVSLWEGNSMPPAGGSGTPLSGRNCNSTITGALAFTNATAPNENRVINITAMPTAANLGSLIIYDRVLDIGGIDMGITSPQAVSMGALPRYATGAGVQMFLEVSTTITGAPIFTVSYTDQTGSAGVTPAVTCSANNLGRFAYNGLSYLPLAAGDTGVRGVTSITFSTSGGGTGRLVLAKQIASLPLLSLGAVVEKDFVTQTPRLPLLPGDHCISFFLMSTSGTTGTIIGTISAVEG